MVWVVFLKEKLEAFDKFKAFKTIVENETKEKIKCLISENGGEFTSKEFDIFCETHGIKRQFYASITPQQNGVAKRRNKTIQEAARTMLSKAILSDGYWRKAIKTSVHILNRGQLGKIIIRLLMSYVLEELLL